MRNVLKRLFKEKVLVVTELFIYPLFFNILRTKIIRVLIYEWLIKYQNFIEKYADIFQYFH